MISYHFLLYNCFFSDESEGPPFPSADPHVAVVNTTFPESQDKIRVQKEAPRTSKTKSEFELFLNEDKEITISFISLPLAKPHAIGSILLCLSSKNQPKEATIHFHRCSDGKIFSRSYSFPRVEGKEWHSLPVYLDSIVRCEIGFSEGWDESSRLFSLSGIRIVIAEDELEGKSRQVPIHFRWLHALDRSCPIPFASINESHCSGVISGLHASKNSSFFNFVTRLSDISFSKIKIPLFKPCKIGGIFMTISNACETRAKDINITCGIEGEKLEYKFRFPKNWSRVSSSEKEPGSDEMVILPFKCRYDVIYIEIEIISLWPSTDIPPSPSSLSSSIFSDLENVSLELRSIAIIHPSNISEHTIEYMKQRKSKVIFPASWTPDAIHLSSSYSKFTPIDNLKIDSKFTIFACDYSLEDAQKLLSSCQYFSSELEQRDHVEDAFEEEEQSLKKEEKNFSTESPGIPFRDLSISFDTPQTLTSIHILIAGNMKHPQFGPKDLDILVITRDGEVLRFPLLISTFHDRQSRWHEVMIDDRREEHDFHAGIGKVVRVVISSIRSVCGNKWSVISGLRFYSERKDDEIYGDLDFGRRSASESHSMQLPSTLTSPLPPLPPLPISAHAEDSISEGSQLSHSQLSHSHSSTTQINAPSMTSNKSSLSCHHTRHHLRKCSEPSIQESVTSRSSSGSLYTVTPRKSAHPLIDSSYISIPIPEIIFEEGDGVSMKKDFISIDKTRVRASKNAKGLGASSLHGFLEESTPINFNKISLPFAADKSSAHDHDSAMMAPDFVSSTPRSVRSRFIASVFIKCYGNENQPKRIRLNFHSEDGRIIEKVCSINRINQSLEWHEIPICIDRVVKCTVISDESWGGLSWCRLYAIRFYSGTFSEKEQQQMLKSYRHDEKRLIRADVSMIVRTSPFTDPPLNRFNPHVLKFTDYNIIINVPEDYDLFHSSISQQMLSSKLVSKDHPLLLPHKFDRFKISHTDEESKNRFMSGYGCIEFSQLIIKFPTPKPVTELYLCLSKGLKQPKELDIVCNYYSPDESPHTDDPKIEIETEKVVSKTVHDLQFFDDPSHSKSILKEVQVQRCHSDSSCEWHSIKLTPPIPLAPIVQSPPRESEEG
ncbi:hypothetical protein ADUPG1_008906, partial [Aduncisulcus paluster]